VLDLLLYWATLIAGAIWSGFVLYNLAWLGDADKSSPLLKIQYTRALKSAVLLPFFWLAFWLLPTRLPPGWPVVALEGMFLIASVRGSHTQLLLLTKSRAGMNRVSNLGTRGFWLLMLVAAAFCFDVFYLSDFASRYSPGPGLAPGSRRVAWLLSFVFAWRLEGCGALLWHYRQDIRKSVREDPSIRARLIQGVMVQLIFSVLLAFMGVNFLGLGTWKRPLGWVSWVLLAIFAIIGWGVRGEVEKDLRRAVDAAEWL